MSTAESSGIPSSEEEVLHFDGVVEDAELQGSEELQEKEAAADNDRVAGQKNLAAGKKVLEMMSQYVNEGKKVLDDAKKIAGDYQHIAVDALSSRIANGRQQAEAYASKANSSIEEIASGTKNTLANPLKRFSETREALFQHSDYCSCTVDFFRRLISALMTKGGPRLESISSTGKKALNKCDTQLAISALAQIVACVLVILRTLLQAMLGIRQVNQFIELSPQLPEMVKSFDPFWVLQLVGCIPVVGNYLRSAAIAFASEVEKNLPDDAQKKCQLNTQE